MPPYRVLVVDDDERVAGAVAESLGRAILDVHLANGVRAARKALATSAFDAVVLDMWMHKENDVDERAGFSVLKAIGDLCPRPAVVILTAHDSPENTLETLEYGADAYLPKTQRGRLEVMAKNLPSLLKRVLRRRRRVTSDPHTAQSVKRARELQKRGFPRDLLDMSVDPRLTIAGGNLPAVWVSGDSYDFIPFADGSQVAFMLCDVVGHDLTAAMVSMHLRATFRLGVESGWSLTAIDRAMDKSLQFLNDEGLFATGAIGVLHPPSRWVELVVAGHPMPSVAGRVGARPRPASCRAGLAWGMGSDRPVLDGFDFSPGQSVIFYSDGIIDIRNNSSRPFGKKRLHFAHQRFHSGNAAQLCEHVLYSAVKFADRVASVEDDLTLLAIRWAPR